MVLLLISLSKLLSLSCRTLVLAMFRVVGWVVVLEEHPHLDTKCDKSHQGRGDGEDAGE